MTNDLISQPWTPPESATMQKVVKYGGMAAIAGGGIYAFTRFAPTMVDAITLLDTIVQDTTHLAVSGAILVGALFLAHETLSSTGSINRLLRLPYWMVINGLTRFFMNIDPLSPITERIKAVRADQATFEKQFETLDGLITNLADKEQQYRGMAAKVQRIGVAANKLGDKDNAVKLAAYKFGSFKEAADSYAATRARLEPLRATFQQISQACDFTAQKLETEASLLRDKWETQKAVHAATDAAGRILGRSKTQTWADAQEAEDIIDTKYSEELGHLDHLKRYSEPLLQSIDVETASYSEDMLHAVQQTSAQLVQATNVTALPAPAQALAGGTSSDLAALIR